MTTVTVKALDTLHVSSVKPDNILAGETFPVSKHIADDLEKRGLVSIEGEADSDAPETKAEPEPENKMEPLAAPQNKSVTAAKRPAKKAD